MILGFGENSVDLVYRLPRYPQPGSADSKVAIDRHDVRCGGQVATTLATCAAMGLQTRYAGAFGNDARGQLIRKELSARGVDLSQAFAREAANRYAVILIAPDGERVVLWQRDPRLAIAATDVRRDWLDGVSLVHVDATDVDAAIALARMARDQELPVTCDVDIVTPRTRELIDLVTIPILAEHLPRELTGHASLERALRAIRRPHHAYLVVTRGVDGAAMLHEDRYLESPGVEVNVVDSTGAGDVFRGAFIAALLRGDDPAAMLRFANAAAAESCTKEGAIGGVPSPS